MKEDDKLINAIIDLGTGMKDLRTELKGLRKDMNHQFGEVNGKLGELNHRVEKLEKQQQRTNMELGEMRLTFIQNSDTVEKMQRLEKRVLKLEQKNIN